MRSTIPIVALTLVLFAMLLTGCKATVSMSQDDRNRLDGYAVQVKQLRDAVESMVSEMKVLNDSLKDLHKQLSGLNQTVGNAQAEIRKQFAEFLPSSGR